MASRPLVTELYTAEPTAAALPASTTQPATAVRRPAALGAGARPPGRWLRCGDVAPGETTGYQVVREGVYRYAAYRFRAGGEMVTHHSSADSSPGGRPGAVAAARPTGDKVAGPESSAPLRGGFQPDFIGRHSVAGRMCAPAVSHWLDLAGNGGGHWSSFLADLKRKSHLSAPSANVPVRIRTRPDARVVTKSRKQK